MDILLERDVKAYQQQRMLNELPLKQQIKEALESNRSNSQRTRFNAFLRALGNARRIRIEVHFDYDELQPEATGG
jgi:hypothetical protein